MKPKITPESEMSAPQNHPWKKEASSLDTSILKKNEFAVIIAGALVVTVLVFFLFFGKSKDKTVSNADVSQGDVATETAVVEKRISDLEAALAKLASAPVPDPLDAPQNPALSKGVQELESRVKRLETALTLKMDALIERVTKVEGQLKAQEKRVEAPVPVAKVTAPPAKPAAPEPAKAKPVQVSKKKEGGLFHTVQKGETLWSISQKYKTTVAAIRKLNNLSDEDDIYPGSAILVR